MNEFEPALTLGEQHELDVAAARFSVQDLLQLEVFDGDAARTMRLHVSTLPEMYSDGAIEVTPLVQVDPGTYYKDERQQVTGAFKPRGAFVNCWFTLEKDPMVREVAACSAGNHAQGVAQFVNWHNQHFGWGLTAHAFMAQNASPAKKDSLRAQGAIIHDEGLNSLEEARSAVQTFVHQTPSAAEIQPYGAPETIAGQGTIMTETILQLWEAGVDTRAQPVVMHVGWGGGGLALGIAEVMKQLIDKGYVHPESKIIAVEEEHNNSGSRGVERYAQGQADMHNLFAPGEFNPSNDGTAVEFADIKNVALAKRYCDQGLLSFVTVTKPEVGQAMVLNPGTEPAGALAIASQRRLFIENLTEDTHTIEVCVVSGGNLTEDKFREYRAAYEESSARASRALGGYVTRQFTTLENGHEYRAPDDVIAAYVDQLSDWGVELLPGSVQRPAPLKR